ncbi:MAG: hypothetical protein K6B73_04755 [Treponema sp.]|nr:hypothetical protein [Treponema sp.]
MNKKILFKLLTLLVTGFIFISCDPEEETYPETKLKISAFPENVKSIHIDGSGNSTPIMENTSGFNGKISNIKGNGVIHINFNDLAESEYDTYAGYGNLESDTSVLKVFANGVELNDTTEYLSSNLYNEETNAKLHSFAASLTIGDSLEITFENAPRKIALNEIKLRRSNNFVYFDLSGIGQHMNASLADGEISSNGNAYGQVYSGGLYYCSKYYDCPELRITAEHNYTISVKNFKANGSSLTDTSGESSHWFTASLESYMGTNYIDSVVSIAGGTTVVTDVSAYAGKTLVSASITKSDASLSDVQSVTLTFDDGTDLENRTAVLSCDGTDETVGWYMDGESCCIDRKFNLNSHSSNLSYDSSRGEYTYYYSSIPGEFDAPYYTVVLTAQ